MRTHYDNLKVSESAPLEVIRAAYRALAQKHHPDSNPDNPDAHRVMQILNDAYDVLSDPDRRAAYDARLTLTRRQQSANSTPPVGPPYSSTYPFPQPQSHPQSSSYPHRPYGRAAANRSTRHVPPFSLWRSLLSGCIRPFLFLILLVYLFGASQIKSCTSQFKHWPAIKPHSEARPYQRTGPFPSR